MWVDRLAKALPRFPRAMPWQWVELDDYALSPDDVEQYAWVVSARHHYAGHLVVSKNRHRLPGGTAACAQSAPGGAATTKDNPVSRGTPLR